MIFPMPKKITTVISGKIDRPETTHEARPEAATDERTETMHAIADELLAAIKAGSKHDVAMALKAFMHEHAASEDEE